MKILNIYTIKEKLEKVHQEKINGALIRSYFKWYQHEEKSFFFNLKKGMTFKIRLEPFHAVKKKKKNSRQLHVQSEQLKQ